MDALHLHKHLTHAGNAADSGAVNETVNQIAFADMVLLNKIDLVSGEQLIAVEDAIRGINAIARLVHTRLDADDCPNWITRVRPQPHLNSGCVYAFSRCEHRDIGKVAWPPMASVFMLYMLC